MPHSHHVKVRKKLNTERNLDSSRVEQRVEATKVKASSNANQDASTARILKKHYSDDRVIMTVAIDYETRIRGYQCGLFKSTCCICPIMAIPANLISCSTLYLCACFPSQKRRIADAHRLTLREGTLLYEVDEHKSSADVESMYYEGEVVPVICEAFYCGTMVDEHVRVIRLAEVLEIRL
jgi:hypothetical protein